MQPVVHLFKAAFLAEQLVRSSAGRAQGRGLRTQGPPGVNLTSLLVLHMLAAYSQRQEARRGRPKSASQIAEQLGCPRTRVSMELKRLRARRWVETEGENRLDRVYGLTEQGVQAARMANSLLGDISRQIHQLNQNSKKQTLVRTLESLAREWMDQSE